MHSPSHKHTAQAASLPSGVWIWVLASVVHGASKAHLASVAQGAEELEVGPAASVAPVACVGVVAGRPCQWEEWVMVEESVQSVVAAEVGSSRLMSAIRQSHCVKGTGRIGRQRVECSA